MLSRLVHRQRLLKHVSTVVLEPFRLLLFLCILQVNQGTVLAVGPGRRTNTGEIIPVAVKEGDKVLLPEYGGTPVKLEEKE
jgi:hypothetical protein